MNEAKNAGAWGTSAWNEATDIYIRMLAPIAPHIAEEIWQLARKKYSVHLQPWPQVDETAIKEDEITLVIQINGKVRDRIIVSVNISEDEAKSKALENQIVQKFLEGKSPQKVIYIQGKLVNIVK